MKYLLMVALLLASTEALAAKKKKPKAKPAPTAAQAPAAKEALSPAELGEQQYEQLEYDAAIATLKPLTDPALPNAKARQRAHFLIAAASFFKRDETTAKTELRELFRENPEYEIDRDVHHPDLVRFYLNEQAEYVTSVSPIIASPSSTASSGPSVETKPPLPQTLGDRQPWLRVLPIIGHFANYDRLGGGIFLGLEIVLVGMNVGGAVASTFFRYPDGAYRPGGFELQIIQNVGAIGAIAVAVACIIDAFVWSPARGRSAFQKTLKIGDYTFMPVPVWR